MRLHQRDITFETAALTVISTYESVALITNRIPTVTSQVRRLPRPLRAALVAGVTVWMADHFEVRPRR